MKKRSIGMVVLLVLFCSGLPISANANEAVVDASEYATLQEAADAIPVGGGVLHIPPGNHEITEPIRIKTGDTRIEGAGTASNIVNKNAEGQPAILIEKPHVRWKVNTFKRAVVASHDRRSACDGQRKKWGRYRGPLHRRDHGPGGHQQLQRGRRTAVALLL